MLTLRLLDKTWGVTANSPEKRALQQPRTSESRFEEVVDAAAEPACQDLKSCLYVGGHLDVCRSTRLGREHCSSPGHPRLALKRLLMLLLSLLDKTWRVDGI